MNIRKFNFIEGSSDKFWHISWDATSFTVCYGRRGTNGTSKTTDSSNVDAEVNKLIASKVKKGYVEEGGVTQTTTPTPAAVKTSTIPTTTKVEKEEVDVENKKPNIPKLDINFTLDSLKSKVYNQKELDEFFNKGCSYEFPKYGAVKDMDKATFWYKKGAKAGSAACCYNLSGCYSNGTGVEVDLHKKFYYLTKAVELDYKNAYNNLGICYKNGDGTKKDLDKAFFYYKKSYYEAKGQMGGYNYAYMIKYDGSEGTPEEAFEAFKFSTASKKLFTYEELAKCYEEGYGTPVKLRDAIMNYKKAEKQDKVDALELEYTKYINSLGSEAVVPFKDLLSEEEFAYYTKELYTATEVKNENNDIVMEIMECGNKAQREILLSSLTTYEPKNSYYGFLNKMLREVYADTVHIRLELAKGLYGESPFNDFVITYSNMMNLFLKSQKYVDKKYMLDLVLRNICSSGVDFNYIQQTSNLCRENFIKNFDLDTKKELLSKCGTTEQKITLVTLMLNDSNDYISELEELIKTALPIEVLEEIEKTDFNVTPVSNELIQQFKDNALSKMLKFGYIGIYAMNKTDFLDKICCVALSVDRNYETDSKLTSYKKESVLKEFNFDINKIIEFTSKFNANKVQILSTFSFEEDVLSNVTKEELINAITSIADYKGALDFVLEKTDLLEIDEMQQIESNSYEPNYSLQRLMNLYQTKFGKDEFFNRGYLLVNKFYKNFYCRECAYIQNFELESKYEKGKNYKTSNLRKIGNMYDIEYAVRDIVGYYTRDSYTAKKNAFINDKDICEYIVEQYKNVDTYTKFFYLDILSASIKDYVDFFVSLNEKTKTLQFIVSRIYRENPEFSKVVLNNLKDSKTTVRKTAFSIIETCYKGSFVEEIKAAYEVEKDVKLKTLMEVYFKNAEIEAAMESGAETELDMASIVKGLTVNTKKVDKYFVDVPTVHFNDGTVADENYLKAMLMVYAKDNVLGVAQMAKTLETDLNTEEKELAVQAIYRIFVKMGAEAKDKWVLYFASVHGGDAMYKILTDDISLWEYSRGAFAGEVVKALALNSNKLSLLKVDSISRKYKHKQIKGAAIDALNFAAKELGLTKEEFLDKIIPTLGFDISGKKTVDYGTRKFNVQLSTELELVVSDESGKKLKTLPAVGKSDDQDIASESLKEFKALKKQLKEVVSIQKARLEATLSTDRKWSYEGFTKLFVENPIMKQFALSLIWATYKDNKIVETFRYMEDGTFNTKDEDEYELVDGMEIGLIHPVELSADDISTWTNQLADYEINQIFNQLGRKVYTKNPTELESNHTKDFCGMTLSPNVLSRILFSHGWERGSVEDAGFFYSYEKNTPLYYCTMNINGVCVVDYDYDDAIVYEIEFFVRGEEANAIKNVSDKFYSEIMYQVDLATASGFKDDNWEKNRE